MSRPAVMLAGIPIASASGRADTGYSTEGGWTDVRLSGGKLYRMTHWSKESIRLSGSGWMGPGFDGVDFSQPQELWLADPKSMAGRTAADRVFTLTSDVRPDFPPIGLALVGRDWERTGVSLAGRVATLDPLPGATAYRVHWLPRYLVFCSPPEEAITGTAGGGQFDWQFTAREV